MTVSIWRRSMTLGVRSCDVAVIGAGICGLSAAAALTRRGLRAVVIERHSAGAGASGRNAGFLMRGAADNYWAACEQYGREVARTLWRVSEENLAMLRRAGIERLGSYRARPSCLVALTEDERAQIEKSAALLREDGFATEVIGTGGGEAPSDSLWNGALARSREAMGLVNPEDACCNPVELVEHLRGLCGCPVLEGQEVLGIDDAGSALSVRMTDGVVNAGRVFIATNAYAGLLVPELAGVVTPRRGQMLAIRAEGRTLAMNYYANHGSEYFREGYDGTLVFGGCRVHREGVEVGYEDRPTEDVQGLIERFACEALGAERVDVVARWTGVMGFSPDGLPLVGSLGRGKGWNDRVWFCGGFTGHGMSLAHRTAAMAVEEMLGGAAGPFSLKRVM
ncbi:MAG: FAD-binding oxidoreductase [Phycisphaeraceae bacterium]|nr:FAD-binding oxidoreductase [Phycisphaeraceae bacterium]